MEIVYQNDLHLSRRLRWPLLIGFLFCSCKVVSTKDAKSTQAFSGAVKTSAAAPGEGLKQYYDLLIDLEKIKKSQLRIGTSILHDLYRIMGYQREEDRLLKGYNASYAALGSYAQLLGTLTNDTTIKHYKNKTLLLRPHWIRCLSGTILIQKGPRARLRRSVD